MNRVVTLTPHMLKGEKFMSEKRFSEFLNSFEEKANDKELAQMKLLEALAEGETDAAENGWCTMEDLEKALARQMATIRLTKRAINDIKKIYDYILEDSPQNAESVKANILHTINNLSLFPLLGMTLEGKINQKTDYRYLIAGKFLIFYKTDEKVVSIYRVLSSEMDYIKLLFK